MSPQNSGWVVEGGSANAKVRGYILPSFWMNEVFGLGCV